jgi:hypothetical protein
LSLWDWYHQNREAIAPLLAPLGSLAVGFGTIIVGGLVAWAALRQARTATRVAEIANRQAEIASQRHDAQTRADQQRRITESFSKAVEQLANDKVEVRLGGIYTLERISRESPDDYWVVMETLTAFVRERARWKERDDAASGTTVALYDDDESSEKRRPEPATDIAAILTVIARRDVKSLDRERVNGWVLDFRGSGLRGANLREVHLEGANFEGAHLEAANLEGAHVKGNLRGAYLEGANLAGAHLEGANLEGAHLKEVYLREAHLEGANLQAAHLEAVNLRGAYLEGANLEGAHLKEAFLAGAHLKEAYLREAHLGGAILETATGLVQDQITRASGNSETTLPPGLTRPEHWT